MSRKLAIVISGAVSLGSYEAGVMYEVLQAIALHNEAVKGDDSKRVVIDVITGASAGAMTAAILSRQLYFGGTELRHPYNNPLFKAWVKEIGIDQLLNVDPSEHKYSLLSSDVIDRIGLEAIPDEPGKPLDPHPASGDTLLLGIAMSNLNGYKQEISGSGSNESFAYSRYKDQFVCRLQRQTAKADQPDSRHPRPAETLHLSEMEPRMKGSKVVWRPMHNTCNWGILRVMALSSGAFPIAFRARRIVRSGGSERSMMATRDSGRKSSAGDQLYGGNYLYTDGGVFENEPVGMAANLTEAIDAGLEDPTRSYLFVAPGRRTIDADPFFNTEDDLVAMATGLASAIFGQSRFQQWVTEGLTGQLLTVTATEASLVGDTFSAFGGFLEYQFLAHDYNIGRRNARQQLRKGNFDHLINDFKSLDAKMPMIDWKDDGENPWKPSTTQESRRPSLYSMEKIPDGYGEYETDLWKAVRDDFASLATPEIRKDRFGNDKRFQGIELRKLMFRVRESRRQLIAKQVNARVDSLVGFFFGKFFDPQQAKRRFGRYGLQLFQLVAMPATKLLLKGLIRPVIASYILNPSVPADPPTSGTSSGASAVDAPSRATTKREENPLE